MTLPSDLTSDPADAFNDALTTHLQARRDQLGAAASMPGIDDLLRRPASVVPLGRPPRRRTTTLALAAAAVMLLVGGTLALTRDDRQPVDTRPASAAVQKLIDSGVPLLFPPGDESSVTADVWPPSDLAIPGMGDNVVDATIETLAAGDAGGPARLLTLVSHRTTETGGGTDPFASLRPSDTFDPSEWFDHPEAYEASPEGATYSLTPDVVPGADRAVLADSPDRADIVAFVRGDQRVALVGVGLTPTELVDAAARLQWADDDVTFGAVPEGFSPLVPRSTRPTMTSPVDVRWDGGSYGIGPLRTAAFVAASSLGNAGAALPEWTVVRSGPDWVLELDGKTKRVVGSRDGAWVSMYLTGAAARLDAATALDHLRTVDGPTFSAAVVRGARDRADVNRKGAERLADRVKEWGGWIPDLGPGVTPDSVSGLGATGPYVGGLTGLVPLWNPATGATINVGDVLSLAGRPSDPKATVLESADLGGRPTEIRTWGTADTGLHAVFDDGDDHEVQVIVSGVTIDQLRDYVDGIEQDRDGTWSATTPAGFEPIPLVGPTDAERSRDTMRRPSGIDAVEIRIGNPADLSALTTIQIGSDDHTADAGLMAQFFGQSPIERVATGDSTWYRVRRTTLPDGTVTGGVVAIPGADGRPFVSAMSSSLTDDELYALATSVHAAGDDEVEAFFAPIANR